MDYGKVAFVGGGNMTRALVGGMLAAGYESGHILISEPQAERRETLGQELPGTSIHKAMSTWFGRPNALCSPSSRR